MLKQLCLYYSIARRKRAVSLMSDQDSIFSFAFSGKAVAQFGRCLAVFLAIAFCEVSRV